MIVIMIKNVMQQHFHDGVNVIVSTYAKQKDDLMGHYDDARIKNLCGLISHESLHGTIGIHESDKASHALDYVMLIYSAPFTA